MFEHNQLDGVKHRLVAANDAFIQAELLEIREPKNNTEPNATPRTQYGVIGGVLVERYLPSESVGETWSHDAAASPWWEVVGHPPHGGIVADYNKATGGAYHRKLDPNNNVVAYAGGGEEVTMTCGIYKVTRKADSKEFNAQTLVALRAQYYTV